jgi:hypothetical protein
MDSSIQHRAYKRDGRLPGCVVMTVSYRFRNPVIVMKQRFSCCSSGFAEACCFSEPNLSGGEMSQHQWVLLTVYVMNWIFLILPHKESWQLLIFRRCQWNVLHLELKWDEIKRDSLHWHLMDEMYHNGLWSTWMKYNRTGIPETCKIVGLKYNNIIPFPISWNVHKSQKSLWFHAPHLHMVLIDTPVGEIGRDFNGSQTTPMTCRFCNSLQFRVWFKCNWCKWCALGKARFAHNFNWCRNLNDYQTTPSKCRFCNSVQFRGWFNSNWCK